MNIDYIINRLTYDGLPVDKDTIIVMSFSEAEMFTEKMDESIQICILNDVEIYDPIVLQNIFERSHIIFLICVGLGFGIYTYKDGVVTEQPELPDGFVLVGNNTTEDVNRKSPVNVKNESLPKPEFRLNNVERNCQSVSISFLAYKNGLRCNRSFDYSGRLLYDCYCKLCDDYQKLLNKNEYGSLDHETIYKVIKYLEESNVDISRLSDEYYDFIRNVAGNYFYLKKGFCCDDEFPAFDDFDELQLIGQDAKVFVPSCLGPETVYSLHKALKGKNVTISRDVLAKPGHRYNTAKVFALLDSELNIYFDDEPLLISNPEEKYDAIIIYRPLLEEKFHFTDAYIRYSDQLLNDQGLLFAYVHSNYAINSENKTKLSRLKDELNLQMTIIATWEKCNNMVSNKCLLLFSPKDLFEGFVLIGNPICGFDKPVSEIMKTRKSNNCTLIKREDLAYPWLMETNIKPNCFEPLSKYFNIYEGTVPNESIFPNGSTGGSGHILTLVKNGKKMELAEGVVPFSEACYCSFYSINYEGAKIYFDGSSFKWDYCYGHGFVPCKGILILETNESAVFECHEDHDDVSKWFDYVMNYFVNPEIEKIHDLDYPLADLIRIIRIPTPKQFRSYEHKSYCSNRYYNIQDKDTIEKLLEVAYSGDVTSIEKDHSGSLVQQILEYNADLYMIAQSDVGNPLELRQLGTYKKSAFAAIRNFEQMIQKLKRDRMSLTDRNEGKHTTDKFLDDQLIRMQRQLQDLLDEWDEISDDGLLFSTESIRETLLKEMKECNEHIESLKTKKTKEISEAERIEQRIENLQNQSMCVINDLDHIDEEIDKICGGQYL